MENLAELQQFGEWLTQQPLVQVIILSVILGVFALIVTVILLIYTNIRSSKQDDRVIDKVLDRFIGEIHHSNNALRAVDGRVSAQNENLAVLSTAMVRTATVNETMMLEMRGKYEQMQREVAAVKEIVERLEKSLSPKTPQLSAPKIVPAPINPLVSDTLPLPFIER